MYRVEFGRRDHLCQLLHVHRLDVDDVCDQHNAIELLGANTH
jgi:hypothetical protein